MTQWLIRLFIKRPDDVKGRSGRAAYGRMAALCGIVCNVLLALIKGVLGVSFHSVAILADAANNLSDVGSCVITLIGFTVSGKPADRDHPFGHERMEAIASLGVSFIILMLGLSLFRTSLVSLWQRDVPEKSVLMIAGLLLSVAVKGWMARFYTSIGRTINSTALFANAADSLGDCLATGAVLLSSLLSLVTTLPTDGIAGLIVVIFIVKGGVSLFKETMDDLLGRRPDAGLIDTIVGKLKSYEGVSGIHDLTVHSYGADTCFATVHMEVQEHEDIASVHERMDTIERDFLSDLNIHLVIHVDPVITDDQEVRALREAAEAAARELDPASSIHDFRLVRSKEGKKLLFDVVVPPRCALSDAEIISYIDRRCKRRDDTLSCIITTDRNYTMEKDD